MEKYNLNLDLADFNIGTQFYKSPYLKPEFKPITNMLKSQIRPINKLNKKGQIIRRRFKNPNTLNRYI